MTAVDIGHSTVMHGVVAQREHKRRGDGPVAEPDIIHSSKRFTFLCSILLRLLRLVLHLKPCRDRLTLFWRVLFINTATLTCRLSIERARMMRNASGTPCSIDVCQWTG
jgi:hypothetical protein